VIARGTFLSGVASATVATGGLDVWDGSGPQIRVLVAADAGGEVPHVFADGTFVFAGRRWRGAPSTVGTPDGRMALVTTIGVDGYLQGVVPLEAPPSWPAGALAAQAIVARTFALARRTLSRPYDVRADDGDQRWAVSMPRRRPRPPRSRARAARPLPTAAPRRQYSTPRAAAATLRTSPLRGAAHPCPTCAASRIRTAFRRPTTAGSARFR
jgi:hypothetical protein